MNVNGAFGPGFTRRAAQLAVACVAGGLLGGGCTTSSATASKPAASQAADSSAQASAGCQVGFALDNYGPERYPQWDEPGLEQALDGEGVVTMSDAKGDVAKQESDIDAFVAAGMDVIIVQPFAEGSSEYNGNVPAAVKRAMTAGIPVISYDNFLETPGALYVGFDWVDAGRMQARAILAARPTGNYVIVKGDAHSPLADMERRGIEEVLAPALDSGAIKIVAETYTHWWDPFQAQGDMDAILQKNANKVDAVIAEEDGLASGVLASLEAAGLEGKVAVSSVSGPGGFPSIPTFNAVARGVQTVDVWQDYRQLGRAAGEAAVQLCRDRDIAKVSGTTRFTTPGGNQLTSILVASIPIKQDNLSVILDAGWLSKDDLCEGVDPATAPAVCG
jgi:D-xylose transport system substrate-binding protein